MYLGLGDNETAGGRVSAQMIAMSASPDNLTCPELEVTLEAALQVFPAATWADSSPEAVGKAQAQGTTRGQAGPLVPFVPLLQSILYSVKSVSRECWTGSFYLSLTPFKGQRLELQWSFPEHSLQVIAHKQPEIKAELERVRNPRMSSPSRNAQLPELVCFTHDR